MDYDFQILVEKKRPHHQTRLDFSNVVDSRNNETPGEQVFVKTDSISTIETVLSAFECWQRILNTDRLASVSLVLTFS